MSSNAWRYLIREMCRVGPWKHGLRSYQEMSTEQEALQENEERNQKRYDASAQAHLLPQQEPTSTAPFHIRWLSNFLFGSSSPPSSTVQSDQVTAEQLAQNIRCSR